MYAVIKTGGKQYRVKPGDLLVVEKLAGEPGAKVAFDQVLMVGEGEAVTVGAPVIEGASVSATLIETRKGEKVKIFKKIRRQGYRRTRGHRQPESVLRVTAIAGDGKSESWDGEVDLTTLAELNLRARNLARGPSATPAAVEVETVAEPQGAGKSPRVRAKVVEHSEPVAEETAGAEEAAPTKKAPTKKVQGKALTAKEAAKASAPKPSKTQARAPAVRKTAPRGNKG
jgi:large subunit ribosomal protein L21